VRLSSCLQNKVQDDNFVLFLSIVACYLIAAWMLASLRFSYAGDRVPVGPAIPSLLIGGVGLCLHLYLLAGTVLTDDGLGLSLPNVVSIMGWQIAAIALIAATRARVRGLSALLLPVAALAVLIGSAGEAPDITQKLSWEMRAHILVSVIAYTLMSIGAAIAALMALQDRSLRNRHPGRLLKVLPPLETMEQVLFATIHVGVILLTLSVFSGLIFVDNAFAQHLVHKTVLSIVALVVFSLLLIGRWRFGWRGRRAIRWTLTGYSVLLLAYFGSRIILEFVLGKQWG
jgi:ABC-type uncharacterized transport system permease subunit